MAIKQDAWERIEQNQKEKLGKGKQYEEWQERREFLLREQLSTEQGREFFYEYVANANALHLEPYTGSSDTYMRCGYQRWPRELLESAKRISFKNYQKMEAEARMREDARKNEE
jgi:hypothetical protein